MRVYFGPTYPKEQDYSIIAILHYLGYSVARTPEEKSDFGYMWDDQTYVDPPADLKGMSLRKPVLNINCTDISKRNVNQIFEKIFGYGSLLDPLTYEGKCIEKPNTNGQGGGKIIDCPIAQIDESDDLVYQFYVETNPGGPQKELRVPIVMGTIPVVFEVYKDDPESLEDKRIKFQMKHSIEPKDVSEVFSSQECEKILRFCSELKFDIGEIDVLRCAKMDRIFIIDANTTPTYFSMFNRYWKPAGKRKSIALVAEKFEQRLLELLSSFS